MQRFFLLLLCFSSLLSLLLLLLLLLLLVVVVVHDFVLLACSYRHGGEPACSRSPSHTCVCGAANIPPSSDDTGCFNTEYATSSIDHTILAPSRSITNLCCACI
jgi:hypothetical protein